MKTVITATLALVAALALAMAGHTVPVPVPASQSIYPWAGVESYDYTSTSVFKSMVDTFTVPSVTCSQTSGVSLWAGMNASPFLVQAGVYAECSAGQTVYGQFWDFYPRTWTGPVGFDVQAGDRVTVRITDSSGTFTVSLADPVHPSADFSVTEQAPAAVYGVESIAEKEYGSPSFTAWTVQSSVNGRGLVRKFLANSDITDWALVSSLSSVRNSAGVVTASRFTVHGTH